MTMPNPAAEVVERLAHKPGSREAEFAAEQRAAFMSRPLAERMQVVIDTTLHATFDDASIAWNRDTIIEAKAEIERLSRERDTGVPDVKTALGLAHAALTAHNDWHLKQIEPQTIDGMEIVPADAYCDSTLYELTQDALHHVERMEAKLSAAPQPPTVSTQGWQDKTGEAPRDWVIRKNGYFYRANRSGYTQEIVAAGLYTEAEAKAEARIEGITAHRASEFIADMPDIVSTLTRERDQAREALAKAFPVFRDAIEIAVRKGIAVDWVQFEAAALKAFERARSVLHQEEGPIDAALSAAPAPEAADGERS